MNDPPKHAPQLASIAICVIAILLVSLASNSTLAELIVTGNVTPADTATWTERTLPRIGDAGHGEMLLTDGDSLALSSFYLGLLNSSGKATISGAGTELNLASYLNVGDGGSGTLLVQDGGRVTSQYGYISNRYDSTSIATITGIESAWDNRGALRLQSGGVLEVLAGGSASSDRAYLSYGSSVSVIGSGSEWRNLRELNVGYGGDGDLYIAGGAAVTSGSGHLGARSQSKGTATITGLGSRWDNLGVLRVGDLAAGVLRVEAGGTLSSETGYIGGYGFNRRGSVVVSGAESLWHNATRLYLGNVYSPGYLRIESGGQVTSGTAYVKGDSSITIMGSDSRWQASHLYLADGGSARMQVVDGGQLSTFGATLGNERNDRGVASVKGQGSSWDCRSALLVGNNGKGTLNVEAGGRLVSYSGTLGAQADATGEATVSGSGSVWDIATELRIASQGAGSLTAADGGRVSCSTLWASPQNIHGDGTIAASHGAVVDWDLQFNASSGPRAVLPFGVGGTLTVDVDGGPLGVGYKNEANLTIDGGVTITSSEGYLGYSEGASGTAVVAGPGSRWNIGAVRGQLYVGYFGYGSLEVVSGGQVATGDTYLGYRGAGGDATVSGSDSTLTTYYDLAIRSGGTLTISNSGLVSVGRTLAAGTSSGGSIHMKSGGMLALRGKADETLVDYLDLIDGANAIYYWNQSLGDWSVLSESIIEDEYSLRYVATGVLSGYTILTVGSRSVPEPETALAAIPILAVCMAPRRKRRTLVA